MSAPPAPMVTWVEVVAGRFPEDLGDGECRRIWVKVHALGWLVGWLAGCSRDKSVDMLGESLVGWLINSMIQHLNGGLIGLLIV